MQVGYPVQTFLHQAQDLFFVLDLLLLPAAANGILGCYEILQKVPHLFAAKPSAFFDKKLFCLLHCIKYMPVYFAKKH